MSPLQVLVGCACLLVVVASLPGPQWRKPLCLLGVAGTAAYLAWRWHSVEAVALAPEGQRVWVWFCFIAEAVFIAEFWSFLLLCSRHSNRRPQANAHEAASRDGRILPPVDVFIATYNEELSILEKTILGALEMDYPNFTVHVLDDGRRPWLKEFCAELGVSYITRPDNRDKKAGNHNHAFSVTDAPLVAVFDADFVPFRNFLRRTIGFFEEADVGIVQTPQCFYNKDSFQINLGMQNSLLDDQRFFFHRVMPCRDAWNVAFYVGSSAVLRRSAIKDIGGIATGLDTEDQATSVALYAAGWRTLYLDEQLSCGLSPESTFALIEQRKRWCRGGIQLLFKAYGPAGPLMRRPLERLFFMPTFWLLGYLNPLFFLTECLGSWLMGWSPFVAVEPAETTLGTVAGFVVFSSVLLWLGRGTWLPLLSPAFQLFLSFAVLPTALGTLVKPFGKPLLSILDVTPKGADAMKSRINWTALVPLSLSLAGLIFAILSTLFDSLPGRSNPGENFILSTWTVVLLVQILLAAMVCFERGYRREEVRIPVALAAIAQAEGQAIPCQVADMSLTGARLLMDPAFKPEMLELFGMTLPCLPRRPGKEGWGVEFVLSPSQRRRLVVALFTRRWAADCPRLDPSTTLLAMLRSLVAG